MKLLLSATMGLMAVAILSPTAVSVRGAEWTELAVKGRANANASIDSRDQFVAVAWGAATKDSTTDVFVAISRDAGRTFRAPVRVNDVIGDARLSGEQPPRVSLAPRRGLPPSVVVVWTSKAAGGTRLLQSESVDGGVSFGRAAALPGGDAVGNRGWESTAVDRDGHVVVVWLDHREAASAGKAAPMHHEGQDHTGHGTPAIDGADKAQLSKLYFSRLAEVGAGSGGAQVVASGVCYCCKTAVAAGVDGSVYAVWRHVYPGNIRDIAFTVSRDNGKTFASPIRVSDDRWVLDGCPENGPAMAVDGRNRAHVIWPTLVSGSTADSEPTLALFYASTDGRQFTQRERVPTQGLPKHPQIAIDARGSIVASWDEQANGMRRVVIGRTVADGKGPARFTREIVDASAAVYPVVAPVTDGVAVAWTSGPPDASVIRFRRVP